MTTIDADTAIADTAIADTAIADTVHTAGADDRDNTGSTRTGR